MSDNRRRDARHIACYPADIHQAGSQTDLALIRDISVTGAMLFLASAPSPGDLLSLSLYIDPADSERPVSAWARVVRVNRRDEAGIWRFSAAVEFDPALENLRAQIEALASLEPPKVGRP